MDCHWMKISPSLSKGISIINQIDESRFDQFLRRIVAKLTLTSTEIFTDDERLKLEKIFGIEQENLIMSIKTLQYIFKRMLKYIFMPIDLKNDLKTIGLNNEKADSIVKVWSAETRTTLNELGSTTNETNDSLNFLWKLNAELSSDYRKKCKIPKAYLSLKREWNETEIELTHPELFLSLYKDKKHIMGMNDQIECGVICDGPSYKSNTSINIVVRVVIKPART